MARAVLGPGRSPWAMVAQGGFFRQAAPDRDQGTAKAGPFGGLRWIVVPS
jgi:hypothetical protein